MNKKSIITKPAYILVALVVCHVYYNCGPKVADRYSYREDVDFQDVRFVQYARCAAEYITNAEPFNKHANVTGIASLCGDDIEVRYYSRGPEPRLIRIDTVRNTNK